MPQGRCALFRIDLCYVCAPTPILSLPLLCPFAVCVCRLPLSVRQAGRQGVLVPASNRILNYTNQLRTLLEMQQAAEWNE